MIIGTATYRGEELEVEFSAVGHLEDYGVPGSPTWVGWDRVTVEKVTLLGLTVDLSALPQDLQTVIRGLATDVDFEETHDA